MSKYAKAIVAILGAVLTAVLASFPDSAAVQQWGPIVSAFLTAIGVYLVPNLPGADASAKAAPAPLQDPRDRW